MVRCNELCVVGGYRHKFFCGILVFSTHTTTFLVAFLKSLLGGSAAKASKECRLFDQIWLFMSPNDPLR